MFYLTWAVTVLLLGFNVPPYHSAGQGILAHRHAMCLSLDLCISYSETSHCTCCVDTNQTLNGVVCDFECDVKRMKSMKSLEIFTNKFYVIQQ